MMNNHLPELEHLLRLLQCQLASSVHKRRSELGGKLLNLPEHRREGAEKKTGSWDEWVWSKERVDSQIVPPLVQPLCVGKGDRLCRSSR